MIFRPYYCLLLAVLTALPAVGQDAALNCLDTQLLDAKNHQQILSRVQSSYNEIKNLSAEFVQSSYLAALETGENSSGKVWFSKPGKMKWDYALPEPQTFIMQDSTVWFYQPQQNQLLIDQLTNILISDLPVAFLMGLGNLAQDFTVDSACKTESGIVLKLMPAKSRESDQALAGFNLLVNEKSYLPLGAEVVDLGGNITKIILKNSKLNSDLEKTIFATDFPKGIDVQDRRKPGAA